MQLLPKPTGDALDRWNFQTFDLVEEIVVKFAYERFHRPRNLGVIKEPALPFVDVSGHVDLHPEAVPMDPSALVALGHTGKLMRGFEGECF